MTTPPDDKTYIRAHHPYHGWSDRLYEGDGLSPFEGYELWTGWRVRVIDAEEMTATEFVRHAEVVLTAVLPQYEVGSEEYSQTIDLIQAIKDMYLVAVAQRRVLKQ